MLNATTNQLLGQVTPYGMMNLQDIISQTKIEYEQYKGINYTKNFDRAFPTYKLFFIEEDDQSWQKFDDYYAYDCVESIKIVKSKNSAADMCELVVTNVTTNLTNSMSVYNRENVNADQTKEEQDVQSMFLSEGTTLMVRMGFSNDIDSLERVFLGKIVAVEYGERIVIQAQSFGAELHEMINNGMPTKYGATSAMRTHGDILLYAMASTQTLIHFGTKSV
jgi:hypothetical protein